MKLPVTRKLAGFLIVLAPCVLHAQSVTAPRVFLVDAAMLAAQKTHPDAQLLSLARKEADTALKTPILTVTAKSETPPSGDKHDYMSMARYFWPNPNTPNHLPYIRKDGQSNPEIHDIGDADNLDKLARSTHALALAYYLTGDEAYAEHAALLLRAWFLAPDTKMNPNLQFAQYIPGVNTGRGTGILDARRLSWVVDALGLLHGSKSWSAADDAGVQQWFSTYYAWLTTSAAGKQEKAATNNHGSWFAVQEASIAMYLGKTDDVRRIGVFVRDKRIPSQFDDKGLQKLELVRTNSFSYSAFNLEALTQLAVIVAPAGVDLYATKPGIVAGLDALLPYDAKHPWPHEQISAGKEDAICPALGRVAAHTHDPKYTEAWTRFDCKATADSTVESLTK